ncbi:hypothetical protein AAVH_17245 [Aphelenchoides avenae]|nr:hypothetical protein AAVH_17245 [Aphelenchus avenae]
MPSPLMSIDEGHSTSSFTEEYRRENERLEQEVASLRQKLSTITQQKAALEHAAEELDSEAHQLHQENDALKGQLTAEKEKHGAEVAKREDLEQRLQSAEMQAYELMEKVVALEHALQSRPECVKEASLLEDSRVPQLTAEVETLQAKKAELGALLNKNTEHLRETLAENEALHKQLAEMQEDLEAVTDAVAHQRKEAEHYKALTTELEMRISELEQPDYKPQAHSLFAEVYDSRKQLEKDVLRLFKERNELRQKLAEATRLARLNNGPKYVSRGDLCDGPTLEAFKMSQSSISDYRSRVLALETQVDALEKENKGLRSASTTRADLRTQLALNIRDSFEREKKTLVTRIRSIEMEVDTLKTALIYEKERNASVPRLEDEVKRLSELLQVYHYESQSPEDKAKLYTDVAEWLTKVGLKNATKKTEKEQVDRTANAENQSPADAEVPFEVKIRQKYEARKKQEETAAAAYDSQKPVPRRQAAKLKAIQPAIFVSAEKK